MEVATQMFNRYVDEMAPHMPAVIFPPGTTAADIRKSKPTLFLSILSAGSSTNHPEIQRTLTKEVMQIYANKIICNGEKSIELVQSLLISTIWYWPPDHFEELKFYQLVHLAAVMAIDLNIGRKNKSNKFRTTIVGLWRDSTLRRSPFPDPEALECRRVLLTCYFLCCSTSMGLRRPNLVRWTSYMTECVEVLETSPEAAPSDKFLCQWVRSQKIAEEVGTQFSMDDPFATVTISDPKVQYALKGFERDLQLWSDRIPKDIRTRECSELFIYV
jgi:Fungal specific transcription factor domain